LNPGALTQCFVNQTRRLCRSLFDQSPIEWLIGLRSALGEALGQKLPRVEGVGGRLFNSVKTHPLVLLNLSDKK